MMRWMTIAAMVVALGLGVPERGEAAGRSTRKNAGAAWLSVAHPGLGEYRNAGWGFFFERCPQKKFWLGFIPLYGWPGYLQIISAIDAYHGRTTDNLEPIPAPKRYQSRQHYEPPEPRY